MSNAPKSAVDGHVQTKHVDCRLTNCQICEGGLFACALCGGLEGAVPTHCPGVSMTLRQVDDVYAGKIDFREGKWIDGCSINSPARWSGSWEIRLNGETQCTIHASDIPSAGKPELNIFRGAVYISTAWPNHTVEVYHRRSDVGILVRDGEILHDETESAGGGS